MLIVEIQEGNVSQKKNNSFIKNNIKLKTKELNQKMHKKVVASRHFERPAQ